MTAASHSPSAGAESRRADRLPRHDPPAPPPDSRIRHSIAGPIGVVQPSSIREPGTWTLANPLNRAAVISYRRHATRRSPSSSGRSKPGRFERAFSVIGTRFGDWRPGPTSWDWGASQTNPKRQRGRFDPGASPPVFSTGSVCGPEGARREEPRATPLLYPTSRKALFSKNFGRPFRALKGHNRTAQGNALGSTRPSNNNL